MPGFPHAMPVAGFLGGLMIGVAAAIMLIGNGRIAGVSGMFARVLGITDGGPPWAIALLFTAGLPLGAGIAAASVGVEGQLSDIACADRRRWPDRGYRNAARVRVHQWSRRMRPVTPVAAVHRRNRHVHGDWHCPVTIMRLSGVVL